jgi:hypothetical protein
MSFLFILLIIKITVTGAMVALPFLLLPTEKLAKLTGAENATSLFRLYGIAITALLVGYAFGIVQISRGEFPTGVVAMGIVSNGGPAAYLFLSGAWQRQKFMSFFLGSIAIALAFAALNTEFAMRVIS